MVPEASLQAAARLLDDRFGLIAVWLHGSEASATARHDSDVDLACLLVRQPSFLELLDLRADLEDIIHRDVDLANLRDASPILMMRVLRGGRLIAAPRPHEMHEFLASVPSRYEDLLRIRAPAERALRERVNSGRS